MTEAKKMSNRLKQAWAKTNITNWDVVEQELKTAQKMINSGDTEPLLVDAYLVISEAFNREFGGKNNGR